MQCNVGEREKGNSLFSCVVVSVLTGVQTNCKHLWLTVVEGNKVKQGSRRTEGHPLDMVLSFYVIKKNLLRNKSSEPLIATIILQVPSPN